MHKSLIIANNLTWSRMYFDHVEVHDDYQITVFSQANTAYYNAVHTPRALDRDSLEAISSYFADKGLEYGFYIDPDTPDQTVSLIAEKGFQRDSRFDINWHYIELTASCLAAINAMQLSSNDVNRDINILRLSLENADQYLDEFIRIDAVTNGLTVNIANQLQGKIYQGLKDQVDNHYFLGFYKTQPAFVGSVGFHNRFAALAEGGTLRAFRLKGLHSQMVRHRLNFSYERGVKQCFFGTLPSAHSNATAKKLGLCRLFTSAFYGMRSHSALR